MFEDRPDVPACFARQNVLVTGGLGFIGSHLAARLASLGAKVLSLDGVLPDRLSARKLPDGVEYAKGDIHKPEILSECALRFCESTGSAIAHVFHLAALNSVPQSLEAPLETIATNTAGTANVLDLCRRLGGMQSVTFLSTGHVYESTTERDTKVHERSTLAPASIYAGSKLAAENLALSYHKVFGLSVRIQRLFNVYGPGQSRDAVVSSIIQQMLAGDQVHVGNTRSIRDFVFVDDVIEGMLRLAAEPRAAGRVVNVGQGDGAAIEEVIAIVAELTGFSGAIERKADRVRAADMAMLVADISLLKELVGWVPSHNLKAGLAKTVQAQRLKGASNG